VDKEISTRSESGGEAKKLNNLVSTYAALFSHNTTTLLNRNVQNRNT
jgi:hypothetical protein